MSETLQNRPLARPHYGKLGLDELFDYARLGDEIALDEFCARVRPGLVQIASFRVGDVSLEDAEDIAHESLLIFVEKHKEVEISPTAFLRTILYNVVGNYLRKRFSVRALNGAGSNGQPDSPHRAHHKVSHEDNVVTRDLLERAERAISAMPEPCRTLLIGLIEGHEVKTLWERSREVEPDLKRGAFDRRLYVCRRKLWGLMGIDL